MTGDILDARTRLAYEDFILDEAALLDAGDYEAWLELFAPQGVYWLPVDVGRERPTDGLNLVYDDVPRLRDRVKRLRSGLSHTEDPPSRTDHLIGSVRAGLVDPADLPAGIALSEQAVVVRSQALITRTRPQEVHSFAARVTHLLEGPVDAPRIRLKRMDLAAAAQALPPLTFLL